MEEKSGYLSPFAQTHMKESEAQSIDTVIKHLIGGTLVLKDDGDPVRKFIGCQG
jgi:hypothetical protein